MNRIQAAMIARQIDTEAAIRLTREGWTVSKLKQLNIFELQQLGLNDQAARNITDSRRPPIPFNVLTKLLFANKFLCCVCRKTEKSVIIHHIKPWAETRSHNQNNLCVLCLEHHDKAHAHSTLSKNLDANTLRALKVSWERLASRLDAESVLGASRLKNESWLYFNHLRVNEIADSLPHGVSYSKSFEIFMTDTKDHDGSSLSSSISKFSYMYDGTYNQALYIFMKTTIDRILAKVHVVNLSDFLDKNILAPILTPGDLIFVQGAHYFKSISKKKSGKGQITEGYRSANNVKVRFVFDLWEATSCSAWSSWLSGRVSAGSLSQIKNIERVNGSIIISTTVLAISRQFDNLKKRDYSPDYSSNYVFFDDGDEGDEEEIKNLI